MQWLARLILVVQELKLKIQIGKTLQAFASFAVFEQVADFFAMHNQRLLPRWQNKLLTRFAAQCQWFVAQYPVLQVWLQKGTVL